MGFGRAESAPLKIFNPSRSFFAVVRRRLLFLTPVENFLDVRPSISNPIISFLGLRPCPPLSFLTPVEVFFYGSPPPCLRLSPIFNPSRSFLDLRPCPPLLHLIFNPSRSCLSWSPLMPAALRSSISTTIRSFLGSPPISDTLLILTPVEVFFL